MDFMLAVTDNVVCVFPPSTNVLAFLFMYIPFKPCQRHLYVNLGLCIVLPGQAVDGTKCSREEQDMF